MQRLTLVLAVALLLPGVATAETVTITYKIKGGTVRVDVPPGLITGGTFKVTLPAATKSKLVSGVGTLQSFSVMASGITPPAFAAGAFTPRLKSPAAVYGYAAGSFKGIQKLEFTGTNVVQPASVPYILNLTVNPASPSTIPRFRFNTVTLAGTFHGYYSLVGGNDGPITASFTGEEIDRAFTPEPGGTWLAMSALASLCGLNLWARRRRGA